MKLHIVSLNDTATVQIQTACPDPEFCQRGSNFGVCFDLVDEGREYPNTTIGGPSLACQRNAIQMAFRWLADDVPTLNDGLAAL